MAWILDALSCEMFRGVAIQIGPSSPTWNRAQILAVDDGAQWNQDSASDVHSRQSALAQHPANTFPVNVPPHCQLVGIQELSLVLFFYLFCDLRQPLAVVGMGGT
jgi:hypothetical protein